MAGSQVSEAVALTILQAQRLGYIALSFDEWTTTNEPEIQAGSKIEIAGSMYTFGSAEDIDPDGDWAGFGNSTQIYCKLVVSGTNVTSKLTTTAPTWDDARQGYYGTGGSALHRYYAKIYKDSSGNYDRKAIYQNRNIIYGNRILELIENTTNSDANIRFATDANLLWDESEDEFYMNKSLKVDDGIETDGTKLKTKVITIGDWDMDLTPSVTLSTSSYEIRIVLVIIRQDSDASRVNLEYIQAGSQGGYWNINGSGDLVLTRNAGGPFDNASFNATSFNRGWATIIYEA